MVKPSAEAVSVTAIVPTFNRADLLPQALDSLLAQSHPIDEIIVVDDASRDGTDQVAQAYGERLRYVRRLTNAGKPAALNWALALAHGTYIWIFDDDDVALPDALANQLAYLGANRDIDFSYSDKYIVEDDGDIWQRDRWRLAPLPSLTPADFFERTLYTMNTMLQGMLVPARCYREVGGFDPTLDRCEDHEMLLRLARRFRGGNMGQPSFVYRHHGGVRGSSTLAHRGDERFRVMLDYRRQIFRRLRLDYALDLFTPNFYYDQRLASAKETLALLQRGCVMLHHGLVDEALVDLGDALPALARQDFDSDELRAMLSRATHIEASIWPNGWRDLARLAKTLAATNTLALNPVFARGVYWQLRREWQDKDPAASAQLATMLSSFLARCQYQRLPSSAGIFKPSRARGHGERRRG